jgi:hypothetical protein
MELHKLSSLEYPHIGVNACDESNDDGGRISVWKKAEGEAFSSLEISYVHPSYSQFRD